MKNYLLLSERAIKVIALVLLGVGSCIAILAFLVIYQPPDFTGYRSSVPLNGASLIQSELSYDEIDKISRVGVVYRQVYESGVVLFEDRLSVNRITGQSWVTCEERKSRNTDGAEFSCTEAPIKNGGQYSVSVYRRNGKVTYMWVTAEIGETDLWLWIPEGQMEDLARYTGWQEYFDAMRPKSLLLTPYMHRPSPLREG